MRSRRQRAEAPGKAGETSLFWEYNEETQMYHNRAINSNIRTKPFIAKGGILAGARQCSWVWR